MSVAACSHPVVDCSYEVVLKNKDTKGQLMSLQQTLRQEIHAKIGAQSAEESAKRKVRCTCCTQPSWADPSSSAGPVSPKMMHMISLCSTTQSCLVIRAAIGHTPPAFPCLVCMDADSPASCNAVVCSFC